MRAIKLILVIMIVLALGLGLSYIVGWLLSMLVNPILIHFGVAKISPFMGMLIVLAINLIVGIVKK